MLKNYFGDFKIGKLQTKRFTILWIVLVLFFLACCLAVGFSIGIAEHLVGGDLAQAQQLLREKLAIPAIVIVLLSGLAFLFAKLNIIAKRARDIGFPGWLSAIVLAGLIGGVTQGATGTVAGGIGALILILLAFLPSNMIGKLGN